MRIPRRRKASGLIPKSLIESTYFSAERTAIDEAQRTVDETQSRLDELTEEQTGDDGYLRDFLNDKDKVDAKQVTAALRELKKANSDHEAFHILNEWAELNKRLKDQAKIVKELNAALDAKLKEKYPTLSVGEIKELLGLNKESKVLLFSTEGNTDPEYFLRVVWDGAYGIGN